MPFMEEAADIFQTVKHFQKSASEEPASPPSDNPISPSVLYAINTAPVHLNLCIPYAPAHMDFNSTGRTVLFYLKLLIISPFRNVSLVKSIVWLYCTPMPFQTPSICEEQFESELASSDVKRPQWIVFQELDAGRVSSLSVPRKQYIGSANTGGCITIFL